MMLIISMSHKDSLRQTALTRRLWRDGAIVYCLNLTGRPVTDM